jgi:hypothetical protein
MPRGPARRPHRRSPIARRKALRVAFLDEANKALPVSDVTFAKTEAYPA